MDRVRGLVAFVVVAALSPLLVPVDAQVPPTPEPPAIPEAPLPIIGETVDPLLERLVPFLENESQEDLHSERIDMELLVDMRNIDYSILGILFGGGKVSADVRTELGFDFGAVSAVRLDQALEHTTGDANVTLNNTFGIDSSRLAITAEEIRLIGGGVLLEAFQSFQEQATRSMIEAMLPGIIVLQADFAWSNTLPASELRDREADVSLRDPPIHLSAALTIQYLERFSAYELVQDAMAERDPDEEKAKEARSAAKRSLMENQTIPLNQRNAFMFMGYGQLLDLDLPSGWRLNMTLQVPKGFTIEGSTDELIVDDAHRTATFYLDGSKRSEAFETAGVITVSNRFLVTATVVAAVLLLGVVGRFLVESVLISGRAGVHRFGESAVAGDAEGTETAAPGPGSS